MKTTNNIEIPELYQNIFKRAKKSRAYAVKANCLLCCCFQRAEIKDYIPECPLYPHRPYQDKIEP